MYQSTVYLKIEEAYHKLKTTLLERGCKIISEEPPRSLHVWQGSLWGLSPRTAKKIMCITLTEVGKKTNAKVTSKLASDWKNITIIGCILAFIFALVCVWMATDLSRFMFDGNPSFWSWIVTVGDRVTYQTGEAFVNLVFGLAIFLFVVIFLELGILFNVRSKIDVFAEDAFKFLT